MAAGSDRAARASHFARHRCRGAAGCAFDSAEAYVTFFEARYGPTVTARERLTVEGRWNECRAELVAMAERRNAATDGTLLLPSEYLVAVGRRAG